MARPNILLIHTDQQRWDALGANGNEEIQTPNLDRLATQGVNFDRYFVQSPVCAPSRASYMTGQYPSQLGIFTNGVSLPEDTPTVASLFSQAGYQTANLGKLHFRPHANRDHRDAHPDYGFDHIAISETPGVYHDAYRAWVAAEHPDTLDGLSVGRSPGAQAWQDVMGVEDGISHPERVEGTSEFVPRPFPGPEGATHTAFVAEQTLQYLEEHQDDRFLCVSGFFAPHQPYVVPRSYLDLYDRESLSVPEFPPEVESERVEMDGFDDEALRAARHGYYALVSEVDNHVGRILDRLDELGLAEETLVVFTSDHGEYLGDHLQYAKGFPGEDCISRVPFVVRWPGGVAAPGRTESALVEAVDLVPTLLQCAGIQGPSHLHGTSLLPVLRDERFTGKDLILHEGGSDRFAGRSVRTDRFRYVLWQSGEEELYDLDGEFGEYRDIADEEAYAEDLGAMRHAMLQRLVEIAPREPREYVY